MSIGTGLNSNILTSIQSMSASDLINLINMAKQEETSRKTKIENNYGALFSKIIGTDKIYQLPEVQAKDLKLEKDPKYPQGVVRPSMLGEHSAVRGIMGSNRPFIAIKIELLNAETKKVYGVVVELIFKRYPIDGDGGKGAYYENNYVTALNNASESGESYPSMIYGSGGMSNKQIQVVADILDGKTYHVWNTLIRRAQ